MHNIMQTSIILVWLCGFIIYLQYFSKCFQTENVSAIFKASNISSSVFQIFQQAIFHFFPHQFSKIMSYDAFKAVATILETLNFKHPYLYLTHTYKYSTSFLTPSIGTKLELGMPLHNGELNINPPKQSTD